MKLFSRLALSLVIVVLPFAGCSQQQADEDFEIEVQQSLYAKGAGPLILIDEGHNNFHTLNGKFAPFAKLARAYGFKVQKLSGNINAGMLAKAKILVIANALNEDNVNNWAQPVASAFTTAEIDEIRNWVKGGGRLFLLADHMPFAGAAANLASALGYTFYDGFALRRPKRPADLFRFADSTLTLNEITTRNGGVDSVVSFTGQAFRVPTDATSVITLDTSYKILLPQVAWEFSNKTPILPAAGFSQLAYSTYGSGKIIVAGEAAMFTAQKAGGTAIGFNAPVAKNNGRLLLNILAWLAE